MAIVWKKTKDLLSKKTKKDKVDLDKVIEFVRSDPERFPVYINELNEVVDDGLVFEAHVKSRNIYIPCIICNEEDIKVYWEIIQ
jgi:hypothetical protein